MYCQLLTFCNSPNSHHVWLRWTVVGVSVGVWGEDSQEGQMLVRLGRGRGQRWVWLDQLRWVCMQPFAGAETAAGYHETTH